jgi:hypothetical protein
MKHLKTFEKYSYGEYDLTEEGLKDFARKAVVGGAVAASLIGGTPKTSYGQTKEPVKTEQSAKQSTMFRTSTATQEEKDLIIKVRDLQPSSISQKDFDVIVKQLQELSEKYDNLGVGVCKAYTFDLAQEGAFLRARIQADSSVKQGHNKLMSITIHTEDRNADWTSVCTIIIAR